jgi:membrane protein implicated in regulation of membrane protease activity
MAFEGLSYGWLIILIGAIFFVLEVFSPGFFLLVPGTVLIIIGLLVLLGIDIFSSVYGIIIGIMIAFVAASLTVFFYSRLNTGDERPVTTSMDSVVGKEGIVERDVDETSLSGKVLIEGQVWSARSAGGIIGIGTQVRVTDSKGVHIVVKEIE